MKRGWTLLEILIALSLVAIFIGITMPSYSHFLRQFQRRQAEIELISLMADLQNDLQNTQYYAFKRYKNKIIATPQGSQIKDYCGVLTIDNLGVKTPKECWGN